MFAGKLHVLHDFHRADILSFAVAYCHIGDEHRASVLLHPNRHLAALTIAEIADDGAYHRLYLWWMTGEYLTVYGHLWALEHFRTFIEVAIDVIGIDETDFKGYSVEHGR